MTVLTASNLDLGVYENFIVNGSLNTMPATREDMYDAIVNSMDLGGRATDAQNNYTNKKGSTNYEDNFWEFIDDIKIIKCANASALKRTVQVVVKDEEHNSNILILDSNTRSIHDTGIVSNKHNSVSGELERTTLLFGCSQEEGLLLLLLQNNYNGVNATEQDLLDMYNVGRSQDDVDARKRVAKANLESPRLRIMKDKAVTRPYVDKNIINIIQHYNPQLAKNSKQLKWGISSTLILDHTKKTSVVDATVGTKRGATTSILSQLKVEVSNIDFKDSTVHLSVTLLLTTQVVRATTSDDTYKVEMKMAFNCRNVGATRHLFNLLTHKKTQLVPKKGEKGSFVLRSQTSVGVGISNSHAMEVLDELFPSSKNVNTRDLRYQVMTSMTALELQSRGLNPFVARFLEQRDFLYSDNLVEDSSKFSPDSSYNSSAENNSYLLAVLNNLSKTDEMLKYIDSTLDTYANSEDERNWLSHILNTQLRASTGIHDVDRRNGLLKHLGPTGLRLSEGVEGVRYAIGNDISEVRDFYSVRHLYEHYVINEVAQRELPESDAFHVWAKCSNKNIVAQLAKAQADTYYYTTAIPRLFKRDLPYLTSLMNEDDPYVQLTGYLYGCTKVNAKSMDSVAQEMDIILAEIYEDAVEVMYQIREGYMQVYQGDRGKFKSKKVFEAGLDGNLWKQVLVHNNYYEAIQKLLLSSEVSEFGTLPYYASLLPKFLKSDLPQVLENANVRADSDCKRLSTITYSLWTYANISPVAMITELTYILEDTIQRQRVRSIGSATHLYLDMMKSFHQLVKRGYRSYERFPYSPYSLSLEHDILTYEAELLSQDIDEGVMTAKYATLKDNKKLWKPFKVSGIEGNLILAHPKDSEDLKKEGRDLSHCVGTYASRILNGQCLILFLRRADEPENSFITVELNSRNLRNGKVSYGLGQVQGANSNGYRHVSADLRDSLRSFILPLANMKSESH